MAAAGANLEAGSREAAEELLDQPPSDGPEPKDAAYYAQLPERMVWAQGFAEDTRYWIPTVDRLYDKTTWEFFVRVPAKERALSNGRLVGTRRLPGGDVEWHWRLDQPAIDPFSVGPRSDGPPTRIHFDGGGQSPGPVKAACIVELRDGYACGWCELQGNQLLIIPHHSSPASVRRFTYPREAEIVGRVVGYSTSCVDVADTSMTLL